MSYVFYMHAFRWITWLGYQITSLRFLVLILLLYINLILIILFYKTWGQYEIHHTRLVLSLS